MSNICDENKCCGCRACENICPRNAIKMVDNQKGFSYPVINESKCSNCNMCNIVCPVINKIEFHTPLKIFACKNKNLEDRLSSSSGGVFNEIAKYILENNGKVFGAGFDENFKVKHIGASTTNELENIKRSKYVQSDMNNTFLNIKETLKENKEILFSGTSCQVQAIKNYKGINTDKIFLIDIICHGVPSPKIFEDYKKYLENKYNSKIVNINFRYKNERTTQNIKIDFENGESYISCFDEKDPFYKLFLEDIILRDSCYNCSYKSFDRISDISLGDFWGYKKGQAKDFGDDKGVSLVLINTQKGMEMFEKIKDKIEYFEVSKEDCYPYNCFINFKIPEKRDEIWNNYFENGFDAILDS